MRKGLARAEGTSARAMPASPGRIWKNTIVYGGQSGEQILTPPGDIRAYDVLSGKLLWQFHTQPLPGEFGYDTNPPDGYKYQGGANNWGEMSIDDERGIVYIPTGSSTADFWGADRHGQNLFANCLLALDVRTGKRLWHFQTVHHDLWDLDNVSAPQLVTRHAQRPEGRRCRARRQDRVPLRVQPRHRRAACGRSRSARSARVKFRTSCRGRRSRSRRSRRPSRVSPTLRMMSTRTC